MINISYSLHEISRLCNAKFFIEVSQEIIHKIILDSRKSTPFQNSLFIALKGPRHDGHNYINKIYKKGVRNFIISKSDFPCDLFPKANFIQVENTLTAFQCIAKDHRQKFLIPVIGVTGSSGKTIVKEWLYTCLKSLFYVSKSPKSYNSQTGVALSILGMRKEDEIGIFEAGISQKNEMKFLEKIIHPSIGVFTNIGNAHSENFLSLKDKIQEKLILFSSVNSLIYCKDHEKIHEEISNDINIQNNAKIYSWSYTDPDAFVFIENYAALSKSMQLNILNKNNKISLEIPFKDTVSIENCMHVICTLLVLNIDQNTIKNMLNNLQPIEMRLELIKAKGNSIMINDAYNSDLDSLKIALDFLHQQSGNSKKTVILSDFEETGRQKNEIFKTIAEILDRYEINNIIGVGQNFTKFSSLFPEGSFYSCTKQLLEDIKNIPLENVAILLKGARSFKFEKIARVLEQKNHETVLEVNLNSIAENFHYFKSLLKKETKVMVMVKAFSYGNGAYEIAHHLEYHQADYLAVAYVDEGVLLRKKGVKLPIMVLNSEASQFFQLIEYNLEPEIYSFKQLYHFQNALKSFKKKSYPIHLKIDTGMRRLGFELSEIEKLCDYINHHDEIKITSVFSHLASSEKKEDKVFTERQINTFCEICKIIGSKIKYDFIKHILNSSGIINYPDGELDMVRLGIGLYGIGKKGLENCSSLKSMISQVKTINIGESVGYGRAFIAKNEMKIAIVPIGYADGLRRGLSNRNGKLYVKGFAADIVGNICMDMCMIDISNINAYEEDEVVIWDQQDHILDMAKTLNTIPYEILSQVSQRVKRVFLKE